MLAKLRGILAAGELWNIDLGVNQAPSEGHEDACELQNGMPTILMSSFIKKAVEAKFFRPPVCVAY